VVAGDDRPADLRLLARAARDLPLDEELVGREDELTDDVRRARGAGPLDQRRLARPSPGERRFPVHVRVRLR
jgi:hypothetical protein